MPKFLFNLYKKLSERDDEVIDNDNAQTNLRNFDESDGQITDEHAKIIERSDTIMTFLNNRK